MSKQISEANVSKKKRQVAKLEAKLNKKKQGLTSLETALNSEKQGITKPEAKANKQKEKIELRLSEKIAKLEAKLNKEKESVTKLETKLNAEKRGATLVPTKEQRRIARVEAKLKKKKEKLEFKFGEKKEKLEAWGKDRAGSRRSYRLFVLVGLSLMGVALAAILINIWVSNMGAQSVTITRVFSVAVQEVERASLQEYFRVNGDVMPINSTNVLPNAAGRLINYTVSVGQFVQQNQIIGNIDPSVPGAQFNFSPIRAPIAGTVTALPIELGNMVNQGVVVARIGDLSQLKIEAHIPERFSRSVHVGSTGYMNLPALAGIDYPIVITEIAPVLDPISRTVLTRLQVTQRSEDLMAGMFSSLRINTHLHSNVIVVPQSAIVRRSGEDYLFVVDLSRTAGVFNTLMFEERDFNAIVTMRPITRGASVDGLVVIEEGLLVGESIVVAGQNILTDGARVNFITATLAQSGGN
ncbi:MAG: efflux RND transporter periplasmic adaptor subunit [Spirochaetaceae bacterium]|nr:efflux RND transporter periplasmic adaptor subunit [Spirochaetaceae bacterium]